MKRTLLSALLLAMSLTAAPMVKADRAYYGDDYYYGDEPVVTRQRRVYTERRYVEPSRTYRRDEVRVYRTAPVEDERVVTYRDNYRDDHPHYILPPGPHRIIQHILFGDPIE